MFYLLTLLPFPAVSVGFIETDLIAAMPEEQKQQILEGNAWKVAAAPRPGTPDDVAQVVAFLASEGGQPMGDGQHGECKWRDNYHLRGRAAF